MARLDLPTFEDPAVQRQTQAAWSTTGQSSVAWDTINMTAGLIKHCFTAYISSLCPNHHYFIINAMGMLFQYFKF